MRSGSARHVHHLHSRRLPPTAVLRVVRAHYGAGNQVADVTYAVQQALDMQGASPVKTIRADNGTLRGDPAPGVGKTLIITYTTGGQEMTVITGENKVRED